MNRDVIIIGFFVIILLGFIYYEHGGHFRSEIVNDNTTTFYKAPHFTQIVYSSQYKNSQIIHETFIIRYTRPADYRTLSLQFIAIYSPNTLNRIEYNIYYVKNSTLSIHKAYNFATLTSGTQTFVGGYFMNTYIVNNNGQYSGYIVGADAQTTPITGSIASKYFNEYLPTINSIWSQLNFAPVMSITFPYGVYYVTFPERFYRSIYTSVNTPIHGILIMSTMYSLSFSDGGHGVLPAGTYNVIYWFKVYGDTYTVVFTTVSWSYTIPK